MTVIAWALAAMVTSGVVSPPPVAQTAPSPATSTSAATQPAPAKQPEPTDTRGAARFVRDVGSDYKHFFSWETATWLSVGGGAALAVHAADEYLRDQTQGPDGPTTSLEGGQEYGGAIVQVPLAIGWWIVGHAAGSDRGAAAGRDLLRAQISAVSWTYALKYSVNRTRPDGDPRSFPSGHASAVFATAMVLQDHYGWKLGVPAFAAALYTAASRITDNRHWASDVTFGAFLGMASGRTATLHMRNAKLSLAPWAVPGGGGVQVNVTR